MQITSKMKKITTLICLAVLLSQNIICSFNTMASSIMTPYELEPVHKTKWCIIGDSISDHDQYPEGTILYVDHVVQREDYSVTNLAIRGTGFMAFRTNPLFASFRYGLRVLSMPKDTEVLTVFSSFNDVALLDYEPYAIGSLDDTTEETLCGAMNLFLQRVRSINPKVKIGIVTPLRWIAYEEDDVKRLQCIQYANAVKTWALYNNIPLLDLYYDTETRGYNLFDLANYEHMDGTHISQHIHAGYMYPKVSSFLKELSEMKVQDNGIEESLVKVQSSNEFESMSSNKNGIARLYHNKLGKNKDIVVAINAVHGFRSNLFSDTYAHPDKSPLIESNGKTGPVFVKSGTEGITFDNGEKEVDINLKLASKVMYELLHKGYSVLMIRENNEQKFDDIARDILANNNATIHVSLNYGEYEVDDSIGYISVPQDEKYLNMYPVSNTYEKSEILSNAVINCLRYNGEKIHGEDGKIVRDIQQNAFSTIPTVALQLGNKHSDCSEERLSVLAKRIADGINEYFDYYFVR